MQLNFIYNNKNISIKSATEADAPLLLYWWNDGEIMAHAGFPLGAQTTLEKVKNSISKNTESKQLLIIYCEKIPIGEMNYQEENNVYSLGIKICNKMFQNNGYGTEILKQFFNYLFTKKNAEKITCDTNLKNIRAQFVYENKLKMKRVKTTYNSWTNQIGELCSATFFEITKKDFFNSL